MISSVGLLIKSPLNNIVQIENDLSGHESKQQINIAVIRVLLKTSSGYRAITHTIGLSKMFTWHTYTTCE